MTHGCPGWSRTIGRWPKPSENSSLEADPALSEAIKWGNPTYEKQGKVCYLAATKGYVSLGFFNRTGLTDPHGRIEGTGKKMRHVKIRALSDIDQKRFAAWVREAVALNQG